MSQNNLLASYFTNSADLCTNNTTDLAGRSFFDIIAECKDFSKFQTNSLLIKTYFNAYFFSIEKMKKRHLILLMIVFLIYGRCRAS